MPTEVLYDVTSAGFGRAITYWVMGLAVALLILGIYVGSMDPKRNSWRRIRTTLLVCIITMGFGVPAVLGFRARAQCIDDLVQGRHHHIEGLISDIRVSGNVGLENYRLTIGDKTVTVAAGTRALNCGCLDAPPGLKFVSGEWVRLDFSESGVLKITVFR